MVNHPRVVDFFLFPTHIQAYPDPTQLAAAPSASFI